MNAPLSAFCFVARNDGQRLLLCEVLLFFFVLGGSIIGL